MDALQRQALSTYDLASRKNAYSAIQKLLASDVPDIDIWYPRQLQPINPAFQHFTPNPVNEAWNAFEWEI
jgi:ABC-type transport system substrate-binding protein